MGGRPKFAVGTHSSVIRLLWAPRGIVETTAGSLAIADLVVMLVRSKAGRTSSGAGPHQTNPSTCTLLVSGTTTSAAPAGADGFGSTAGVASPKTGPDQTIFEAGPGFMPHTARYFALAWASGFGSAAGVASPKTGPDQTIVEAGPGFMPRTARYFALA